MDLPSLDHEATVTPYQLCHVCKPIVDLYVSSWETIEYLQTNGIVTIDALALDGLLEPSSPVKKHHATFEDLGSAAVGGCHLCAMFVSQVTDHLALAGGQLYIALDKDRKDATRASVTLWCAATSSGYTGPWTVRACIENKSSPDYRAEEGVLPGGMLVKQKTLETEYRWCVSTGSTTGLDMAAAWLRECVQNHNSCQKNVEVKKPTRLLALGAFFGSSDLKLVHSTEVGNVEYAALSYSWGDRVTTTLKATNLQDFLSRIPFNMLPKSVQEAVKVCQSLGISYLWVDALCILQEDREDFEQEISRMGSIYAGSVVTIAAADSLHCDSGLFRPRRPLACENLVVEGQEATLHLKVPTKCGMHAGYLSMCALSSRAWTFQERSLAPRTIHFDAEEIIWECREHSICHRCAGHDGYLWDHRSPKRQILSLDRISDEPATNHAVQHMWSGLVPLYTDMELSNEDDRLSALAGIAHIVYDKSGFKASYGLWLPCFADELLWRVVDHKTRQGRNADQLKRMPSWSWVSYHGQVRPFEPSVNFKSTPVARKVLYRCNIRALPLPTPFGPLSSLSPEPLRVSGWLTLAMAAAAPQMSAGEESWILRDIYGLWRLIPPSTAEHEQLGMAPRAWPWSDFISPSADSPLLEPRPVESWTTRYWPDEDEKDILGQRLLCLTVKRYIEEKRTFDDPINIHKSRHFTIDEGLVLRMVDTQNKFYRRIGYFCADIAVEKDWAQEKEEVTIV